MNFIACYAHRGADGIIREKSDVISADSKGDALGKFYERHREPLAELRQESETMRRVNELADLLARECPLHEVLGAVRETEGN
jgi:hypothetical protein